MRASNSEQHEDTMNPNELLTGGYRMACRLVHMMCDDLTAEEFRHQPVPGANSAAWVVGHLAITARRFADRLGAADLPALTDEFLGRFNTTKKAAEEQPDLGDKAELLALFDLCMEKLSTALAALPVEMLNNPPPSITVKPANLGEALLFGSMHVAMHCGQISTIRRSLGKPPAV